MADGEQKRVVSEVFGGRGFWRSEGVMMGMVRTEGMCVPFELPCRGLEEMPLDDPLWLALVADDVIRKSALLRSMSWSTYSCIRRGLMVSYGVVSLGVHRPTTDSIEQGLTAV